MILPEEVESLEVSVDLSGKSEILAEDFIGESELKLSNPTEHIATVEAGSKGFIPSLSVEDRVTTEKRRKEE